MTLTLHLGVVDLPYEYGKEARTTGDVAEILEAKYGVMETFYERHEEEITQAIENGLAGSLESILSGAPIRNDLFASSEAKIEQSFRKFLDTKEMDGLAPGVPTQAATRGVNHRLKRPYRRRSSRPSFIDTGLYESSFKAWID